jgi:hypothetical protein
MKYLLVEVIERDISTPEFFDTHKEAYDRMCEYVAQVLGVSVEYIKDNLNEFGDFDWATNVNKNSAYTQRHGNNFDWKIFEV